MIKNELYKFKTPPAYFGNVHCSEYDVKNNEYVTNHNMILASDKDLLVRISENFELGLTVFYHVRCNKFICIGQVFYEKI